MGEAMESRHFVPRLSRYDVGPWTTKARSRRWANGQYRGVIPSRRPRVGVASGVLDIPKTRTAGQPESTVRVDACDTTYPVPEAAVTKARLH
jgi:hypothetical protein